MSEHVRITKGTITATEFRDQVITGLQDLRTKMDALVGVNGNNGRIGSMEDTLANHTISITTMQAVRQTRAQDKRDVMDRLWPMLVAVLSLAIGYLLKK